MKMQQSGGLLPPGVSTGCSIVYSSSAAWASYLQFPTEKLPGFRGKTLVRQWEAPHSDKFLPVFPGGDCDTWTKWKNPAKTT